MIRNVSTVGDESPCVSLSSTFKAAQEQISVRGPRYPPMKLVDMYFWSIGNQLQELEKKKKMETG